MVIILTKWEAVTQGTCALRRQLSLIKTPLITQDYHAELPKRGIVSATAKNARFKGRRAIWTSLSHVFNEKFNGSHLTPSLTWRWFIELNASKPEKQISNNKAQEVEITIVTSTNFPEKHAKSLPLKILNKAGVNFLYLQTAN